MRMTKKLLLTTVAAVCVAASPAMAQNEGDCSAVPNYAQLKKAMEIAAGSTSGITGNNRGFGLEMWGTVVNRDGVVCAVVFTGNDRGDQWPGSRVISAQKANTANAFSLPALALSTANLYTAVQPGGSLAGLQESNPVNVAVAYAGNAANYGRTNDPMVGGKIGGINIFGGGLALYAQGGTLVGGLGVSGDSSCADHNIAWRVRDSLNFDSVPGGVSGDVARPDNIVYDITPQAGQMPGVSKSGWGHPACSDKATDVAAELPAAE